MLKQKEWIEVIVARTGCTKKEAKLFYDCVFEYIKEQIAADEIVKIQGFGVFKLRKTAAKEQINLITGQPEIVPEHNVTTFKPYFEIDPKPEAIEVEDEEIVEEVFVEETPVVAEEQVEEQVQEEVVEDEVEEVATEEDVVEDASEEEVVSEEVEEVAEEVIVAEEDVITEDVPEEDNYVWVFSSKNYTTAEMVELLKEKTLLSESEIRSSLDVIKANMDKVNKSTCEVKESDETFDFIIVK